MGVFKTNFAGDTSTLYANTGRGLCDDRTFAAGFGVNTRGLRWGTAFVDFHNDGWLDLLVGNGHVYPEVRQLKSEPSRSAQNTPSWRLDRRAPSGPLAPVVDVVYDAAP